MRILGLGTTQMPSAQGPKNKLYLNNFLLVCPWVLFYLGFLHSEVAVTSVRWQYCVLPYSWVPPGSPGKPNGILSGRKCCRAITYMVRGRHSR